jgi:hypothetical protein
VNLTTCLYAACAESGPSLVTCRVCQRKGLPILVLREALVPKPASWLDPPKPLADPAIPDMQKGCRILRAGYLYVLLDHSFWQAYQISPDGYLRPFNPYAPPLADGQPLARACVQSDHDMPASLLNLDVDTYHTAALAFSDDPWPVSVLDHYKSGCNVARLQTIDLATARDTPNEIGDFLTAENTKVYDEVYEYAEFVPRFNSVHPFHTRGYRRQAMGNFLRKAPTCGSLGPGMLAIVLKDSVGLVQEYNGLRAQWAHARQVWLEEPERAYQHQTSQILLTIRALHRQWAEPKVASFEPMTGDGPPTFVDPAIERQRVVETLIEESDRRLEERYDEPKRAAFQADYDHQLTAYQKEIDRYAALYAEIFTSPGFQYAMQHDYDGDDPSSGRAYSKTMSLCLRGGISEATGNDTGPTAQMWQKMLQDPNGPVYQALLMRDKNLLAGLLPTFSDTGANDWNDSNKLYTLLTKAITSDEAKHFMRPHLQESIAQVLAALNTASARLNNVQSPGVGHAVSRLNSASQLLYNGIHLVELRVRMSLGDYHDLQSAHLRSLEDKFVNNTDRPNARTRVQPLILGGLSSRATLDPKIASLQVNVSVWAQGGIDHIKTKLRQGVASERLFSDLQGNSSQVIVGMGTLNPLTSKALGGMEVSPLQAQTLVREGFTGLSTASRGLDLLIAIGSLYFMSDAMNKSIKAFEKATGEKSTEANLSLYGGALAMLGGALELVGTALKLGTYNKPGSHRPNPELTNLSRQALDSGTRLVTRGTIIIAASGFIDAAIAGMSSYRLTQAGEKLTGVIYGASSILSSSGAILGIYAAGTASFALMGPLGIAVALTLVAYAFYKWANRRESTRIETWVKRCYFGVANENPKVHWNHSLLSRTALLELNAIIVGMDADVVTRHVVVDNKNLGAGFVRTGAPITTPRWEYKIILPYFSESQSVYCWSFILHRHEGCSLPGKDEGETVATGMHGKPVKQTPASEQHSLPNELTRFNKPNYKIQTTTATLLDSGERPEQTTLIIRGSIEAIADNELQNIKAASLLLTYWPDRNMENAYAKIWVIKS